MEMMLIVVVVSLGALTLIGLALLVGLSLLH